METENNITKRKHVLWFSWKYFKRLINLKSTGNEDSDGNYTIIYMYFNQTIYLSKKGARIVYI